MSDKIEHLGEFGAARPSAKKSGLAINGPVRGESKVPSDKDDFLLSLLRAATLRSKLVTIELDSVGLALKHRLVSHDNALEWLYDLGLFDQVVYRPEFIREGGQ